MLDVEIPLGWSTRCIFVKTFLNFYVFQLHVHKLFTVVA